MSTQTDTLERLANGSRAAIVRLRSLGDCILITPAITLLKRARPDLEIGVVVEERFAAIFEGNPDVSRVLTPRAGAIRSFAPRLCLNLHGGTRSARLTMLSGAGFRAGFAIFRPAWIYNLRIPTAQETMGISRRVHTAEHAASAMFYLGVPITEVPRACVPAAEGRSIHAPGGPYAVIHPAATQPEKTWPADRFLGLARRLSNSGLEPVFIGSTDEDLARFRDWRIVSGAPLPEVARLVRDAALFIGNDSGPAHLAAAFSVPEVVLFGPSDSEVWAPWRTPAEVLQAAGAIDTISVERVLEAADRVRSACPSAVNEVRAS